MKIKIKNKYIGNNYPTYFIADIGANHDGSLQRAKKLIKLCAKAGADAAKFQHFKAETIVSDYGFRNLKIKTHQSKWKQDVFSVYKKASINPKWTEELKKTCEKYKIDFGLARLSDLLFRDRGAELKQAFARFEGGRRDGGSGKGPPR